MKMSRSVYYYHLSHLNGNDRYENIRAKIKDIYSRNHGRYGYRRIQMQLSNEGLQLNHKTVYKIMKELELKGITKKTRYRSYKGEEGRVAPNILDRNFQTSRPNQKWTTDVTQVSIQNKKLYLSPKLDMFNGEIISYTISRSPDLHMVVSMLKKAFKKHHSLEGLVMHSDQGWHYQHGMYQKMLNEKGIMQSMSIKGNCLDNAVMENFFALMKNEVIYPNHYNCVEEFETDLQKYIQWYNNERIKLKLNGMSPIKYRAQ